MFGLHKCLFVITAMSQFINVNTPLQGKTIRYRLHGHTNEGSEFYDNKAFDSVKGWILKPGLAFAKEYGTFCCHAREGKHKWCYNQLSLDGSTQVRIECEDWPPRLWDQMNIRHDMRNQRLTDRSRRAFGDKDYKFDWNG